MRHLLVALLLVGCGDKQKAQAPVPEDHKVIVQEPKPETLVSDRDVQEILVKRFNQMNAVHLVSYEVIAKGTKEGRTAQLLRYLATAEWGQEVDAHLCGLIAVTVDPKWKSMQSIVGADFLPSPDAPCSRDPHMVGNRGEELAKMPFSESLKTYNYKLSIP